MLKNILALFLALVLCVLAGCGAQSSSVAPAAASAAPAPAASAPAPAPAAPAASSKPASSAAQTNKLSSPVNLSFAAQEVGTAAYNYAAALQGVMLKGLPSGSTIDITTTSPGGVGAPIIVNGAAQCDIVMSNAGPAKWSFETGILDNAKTTEIAALAGGMGKDFINVMFTQKFVDTTGIKTMEELVAKKYPVKIIIKKNGTLGEMSAEKVLEALGVTLEDVVAWGGKVEKTGGDAIKSGLQDDLYDMTIDHLGAGQANTTELCLTHDMYCVQLADSTLEALCKMGYDYVTVTAGTWNKQTTDIKTVGSQQVVLVSSTMDKDLAYALTKAICEGDKELGEAVAAMVNFDPKTAGSISLTGVALHPGAKAYYEEMGYKVG